MRVGFLDLPNNWVYITYETGKKKNVANQDTLTQKEADEYKKMWEKPNNKIVKVELFTSDDKLIKTYTY